MLTIQQILKNKERTISKLEERNINNAQRSIEEILATDENRKKTQFALDKALHDAKVISKEIGSLMKEGAHEKADLAKAQTTTLKTKIATLNEEMTTQIAQLTQSLYALPNIHNDHVPVGTSAKDNQVIEEFGELPQLHSQALPHWDLIKKYNLIDFEIGAKITGAGFPVYQGKGAQLQRGLVNFFLDEGTKAGFEEVQPPLLVNKKSGIATGQLPDKEGQMYEITDHDLFLIPTAEVPITNMFRNEIIKVESLPIRKVGYSPCFRREAGSWGAHVRGLNRLHQFDKVEIVQITLPNESYTALKEMRAYIQYLLKKLELPTRVLNLCSGDLGFTSAQTFDMEVYSAAQKSWLEVSSVSNFETFQSNRLKLRYKNEEGKTELLHTLNGSALALPRIMAALLENNQSENGITMPKALLPYLPFDEIN